MSETPKEKEAPEAEDVPKAEDAVTPETEDAAESELSDEAGKTVAEPEEAIPEDLADQLLRARAELDNYRKRAARDKEEAVRWAGGSVLRDLIPVLDSFQMGLESARAEDSESMIFKGMEMVGRQFGDFFDAHGVKVLDPTGDSFDPDLHEAVATEPSDEVQEGSVVRVVRLGYVVRERLLRPANVIVSGPVETDETKEEEAGDSTESDS